MRMQADVKAAIRTNSYYEFARAWSVLSTSMSGSGKLQCSDFGDRESPERAAFNRFRQSE